MEYSLFAKIHSSFCSSAHSTHNKLCPLYKNANKLLATSANLFCITRKHSTFLPTIITINICKLSTPRSSFQVKFCKHPLHECVSFSNQQTFPKDFPSPGHKLAREQDRKIQLRRAQKAKDFAGWLSDRAKFPSVCFQSGRGAMLIIILGELGCCSRTFVYGFIAGAMQCFNLSLAKRRRQIQLA